MTKTDPLYEHTTLNSIVNLLERAILARGLDLDEFVAELGLDPAEYQDPNGRIPVSTMQRAWTLAVELSGDPCFGLSLADVLQPAALHGLGLSMLASSTLKESITRVARYQKIISTSLGIQIEKRADGYLVSLCTKGYPAAPVPATIDGILSVLLQVCRMTASPQVSPKRVKIAHSEPGCAQRFIDFFGCPVIFSAGENSMLFDHPTLDEELYSANPELARANDRTVIDYLDSFDRKSLTTRVREQIIEHLPGGLPREERIAHDLHMSLRSLQRALKTERVSYKQIVDEIRQTLATRYLEDNRYPIIEISYLLGFSEQSNFTRAFKRWTGSTPVKYRHSHL